MGEKSPERPMELLSPILSPILSPEPKSSTHSMGDIIDVDPGSPDSAASASDSGMFVPLPQKNKTSTSSSFGNGSSLVGE